MVGFLLEPNWKEHAVDDRISVLLQPAILDAKGKKHLMVTSVRRQFVCLEATLTDGCAFTLLNARISDLTKGVRLTADSATEVLCHAVPTTDIFHHAAETCAGIGVLGTGLEAAGMTVKTSNELRQPLIDFQVQQGRSNFVQGDINDPATLAAMHRQCPSSFLLTAGISCQPWSKLGDSRKFDDGRSDTLVGVLRAGFLLRSWGILLECVTEAGQDPKVQEVLDDFCVQTNYRKSVMNMKL